VKATLAGLFDTWRTLPLQVPLSSCSVLLQRQPMRSEPTGLLRLAQPSDMHRAGGR